MPTTGNSAHCWQSQRRAEGMSSPWEGLEGLSEARQLCVAQALVLK